MRGGKRQGAGRKKKPEYLRRKVISIRLPQWMISQLKEKGQIGYMIESELAKHDLLRIPNDYNIDR
jgi:hypothetical protein